MVHGFGPVILLVKEKRRKIIKKLIICKLYA